MQNKSFAIGATGAFESELHQRNHLVGRGNIFGRRNAPVGNHIFSGEGFVRLMELEFRFIAGANVGAPGGILKMKREQALRAASGKVLDRAQGEAIQPWLERQSFRLFFSLWPLSQSARQ